MTDTIRAPIAFFDLDLTLLEINSAQLWIKRERKLGSISRFQLLKAAWWLCNYRLGLQNIEPAIREAIYALKGRSEEDFKDQTALFFAEEVKHRFRPGGVEEIIQRRAEGIQCYLMTSASSYLADLAAEFLELDGVIAQRFEVQNGVFTGYSEGELCFGEGKLHLAQALLSSRAVDPSNCYFYTDSFTDLPLLQSVGFPRCVFPDPHLRRAANKEKWPILAW